MSLILQCNLAQKIIRIQFDAEGRQLLLRDMEVALREYDHAFGVLGVQLDEPEEVSPEWKTVDFYNIVCLTEEKAPLKVDNSVTISGGRKALSALRDKIKALPDGHTHLELRITDIFPSPQKKSTTPWYIGLACCAPFLYMAGHRICMFCLNGDDAVGFQTWFHLAAALCVLPMPWLISLRSGLSSRLNAGFGVIALVSLLMLVSGLFQSPCKYTGISEPVFDAMLLGTAGLILAAALVPLFLWRETPAVEKEKRILKWVDVLVLRPLGGAVLFAVLMVGAALYAISFCYDEVEHWYDYFLYIPLCAAFTPPVAVLAGLLNPGIWQRAAYRLLCCTLLPGLVLAAPCYYFGATIAGLDSPLFRLLLAAIPLLLALCLFPYLKKGTEKRQS